jgi:serine phosphatase RsbU (regulator of sigma subunit)
VKGDLVEPKAVALVDQREGVDLTRAPSPPHRLREAVAGPSLGWLLPYALVAAVLVADLWLTRFSTANFLVLAPLLASRLSSDRRQVVAAGVVALATGVLLAAHANGLADGQWLLRLALVAVGTLVGLVNWGVLQREQSALERSADTAKLAVSLVAGVEPEEAYELLARSAATLYAADAAAVYRRHDDRMLLVAEHRDQHVAPLPSRLASATLPAAFAERPFQASVRSLVAPEATMLEARGLGSVLWLPLVDASGTQTGTIALAWRRPDPHLSEQELEASQQFASLGARAISGSERARAQAEVLERVQELLLTTPPAWVSGWQVAVRYQSASGLAQIGGDFYDLVEVEEGRGIAFILADARGKGLEASSLGSVLKGAFRTLAGEGVGPARVLGRLDRLVSREGGDEDFVTALVGRAHGNGRVVLASAGHPYPLGAAPRATRVGAPLGLGTRTFESQSTLRAGQRLVCYTDGLVEARDADGRFIDGAVLERALRRRSLDDALDELVAAADRHSAGRRFDDLALLGLEYAPDGPD